MEVFQQILVYLTLAVAVGFVVRKFFWPKSLSTSKKNSTKACGQDDCACH